VRINGTLDAMGFRLLKDRDEVWVRGLQPFYFSTERLPQVETFPGGAEPVHCPRCHDPILAGSPAVCCPECHTWHHQRPDRECWTYSDKCFFCPQPTALSNHYRWQPQPGLAA
jgi:hypothetical protein